jgi:hypothetical protein
MKRKSNSIKVNSSKCKKRGADRAKHISVQQCKKLSLLNAGCPQEFQHTWDRVGKSYSRMNADAFVLRILKDSRGNSVEADSWCGDSGAKRHITPNKNYLGF